MSPANLAFLILVVIAFATFIVALAWVSLYVRGAPSATKARRGETDHSAPADAQ